MYFSIFGQDSLNGNVVNEKGAKVKYIFGQMQHVITGPRLRPIDKGDKEG